MSLAPNFFDSKTRNWRARQAVSVEMMRELSRYSDPHELSLVFSHRMSQLFPTDRQLTLSRRGVEPPDFRVTRFNLWAESVNPYTHWHRFPVHSGGLFSELLYADEARVFDDLQLAPDDPAAEYIDGQRSLLAIPVFEHGVATTIVIVTREEANAFPPEQVPELVWMTNLFGRATQTLQLTNALKDAYEAADAELKAVGELQRSLLPAAQPEVPGLDLAVHYRTCGRAGGDYYDYFPLADGSLGVLVADVAGHGTAAAVLMAVTHNIAHSNPAAPTRPGLFLSHLNNHLAGRYSHQSGAFVTAFYAVFDPIRGTLTYASAGHVPPRLVRCADGSLIPLNRAQRLPLGISPPDTVYPDQRIELIPGDQVVLFTDGITEAVGRDGDVFGTERLDAVLATCPLAADSLLIGMLGELESFTDFAAPTDDRTLLVVRRTSELEA